MTHWKVILVTVLIFGAGVVTGGLLVRHTTPFRPASSHATPARSAGGGPGGSRVEFLRRAQRELDLTPGQHQKIDAILKESQERTRQIMEPVSPRIQEELHRTRQQFREVLTPAQKVRFDELLKRPQRSREPRRPKLEPAPIPADGQPAGT